MDPAKIRKRLINGLRGFTAVLTCLAIAYILLLCFPSPCFPFRAKDRYLTLYSSKPIPPQAAQTLLADVTARLETSPVFNPQLAYNVFLCDTPLKFALFANLKMRQGGIMYPLFGGHIFLRPASLEENRLFGPSGRTVEGGRTLAYFIAHEAMHRAIASRMGVLAYLRLPTWKNEGYADYVAYRPFDDQEMRRALRRQDDALNPAASGLYHLYHLMVDEVLNHRRLSVDDLFSRSIDGDDVLRALTHRPASPMSSP